MRLAEDDSRFGLARLRTTSGLCLNSTGVSLKLLKGGSSCCVRNIVVKLLGPVIASRGPVYKQPLAVYRQDLLV